MESMGLLKARLPDDFWSLGSQCPHNGHFESRLPPEFWWVIGRAHGLDRSELLVFERFLRIPVNNCDWKTGGGRAVYIETEDDWVDPKREEVVEH